MQTPVQTPPGTRPVHPPRRPFRLQGLLRVGQGLEVLALPRLTGVTDDGHREDPWRTASFMYIASKGCSRNSPSRLATFFTGLVGIGPELERLESIESSCTVAPLKARTLELQRSKLLTCPHRGERRGDGVTGVTGRVASIDSLGPMDDLGEKKKKNS